MYLQAIQPRLSFVITTKISTVLLPCPLPGIYLTAPGEPDRPTTHDLPGNDQLTGSAGADTFVFDSLSGVDTIKDYKVSESDKLVFDKTVFTKLADGIATGNVVITSATTVSAVDDSNFLLFSTKTGKLYYDADANGSGVAVQIAGIKGSFTGMDYTSFTVV